MPDLRGTKAFLTSRNRKPKGAKRPPPEQAIRVASMRIPLVILCLAISVGGSFGCTYRTGAKVYDATASTKAGKRYVEALHVKYVCENVYGIYWTDILRPGRGVFATNVREIKMYSDKTRVLYRPISREVVDRLGLEPDFSLWERFGRIAFAIIAVIVASHVVWTKYLEHVERIEVGHIFARTRSRVIPLLVRPTEFQTGHKIIEIEGDRVRIRLDSSWRDYRILTTDLPKYKHVSLQLVRLYDRKSLIDRYKHATYMIPSEKLKIIDEVSSEYRQLLRENTIRCLRPIEADRVYARLLDVRGANLNGVSWLFAGHLRIPMVRTEFSRRLSTPGRSHVKKVTVLFSEQLFPRIEISIDYMNDLKALAAIIAHEYTHVYRITKKLAIRAEAREEIMTDISSIVLGFDELILQGMSSIRPVGYLTPGVVAEFCEIVDEIRRV